MIVLVLCSLCSFRVFFTLKDMEKPKKYCIAIFETFWQLPSKLPFWLPLPLPFAVAVAVAVEILDGSAAVKNLREF